jgi:hypothetical protein
MAKIVIVLDSSVDYPTTDKIRRDIVKSLKQHNLPIIMSFCEDSRQIDTPVVAPNDTIKLP